MRCLMRCLNLALTVLCTAVIAAAACVVISAHLAGDQIPTVAGYKVLTVLSGSMEPAIPTGGVVVVKSLAPGEQARVGDVITFRTGDGASTPITHRVVGMDEIAGTPAYLTKGDANEVADPAPVVQTGVLGRVRFSVPYMGYVFNFVKTPLGLMLLVVVPAGAVMAIEVFNIYRLIRQGKGRTGLPQHEESAGTHTGV